MLVALRTVEGEQVNESCNASVTVRRFTRPELCGARSSRAQRRRFAAVGVLAAVLVSGCGERSNGVTVTRASGSLGVASPDLALTTAPRVVRGAGMSD